MCLAFFCLSLLPSWTQLSWFSPSQTKFDLQWPSLSAPYLTRWWIVDSVFCALWLATQTQDGICYSTPSICLDFPCKFSLISQNKGTIWCWLSTGLLKQLFTLVLAKTNRHLPHREYPPLFTSISVNNCQILTKWQQETSGNKLDPGNNVCKLVRVHHIGQSNRSMLKQKPHAKVTC